MRGLGTNIFILFIYLFVYYWEERWFLVTFLWNHNDNDRGDKRVDTAFNYFVSNS